MVKRQKEKSYPSSREQRAHSLQGQFGNNARNSTVQRRLPFDCCALTLTPYQQPVCIPFLSSSPGIAVLFDNSALIPFVLEHGKDPVSGQPLSIRQIITCEMDRDDEGRWQCPILTKPLTDHMKIVAVIQRDSSSAENVNLTAHVYSYEAYQELNVKTKNYQDLISGLKFHPQKDVLVLNDTTNNELEALRDINNFYHVQHGRELEQSKSSGSRTSNVQYSITATRIMEKLQQQKVQQKEEEESKKRTLDQTETKSADDDEFAKKYKDVLSEDVTGVALNTALASGSLTSTAMMSSSSSTTSASKPATRDEILQAQFQMMKRLKKKGHVLIQTNLGNILVELHCDIAPRTCTNFLQLAQTGQYDGSKFHRLIPKFMIQGGKPKDKTQEETSIWGPAFADEFDDRLKHVGPGVLSMANAGAGTNKRQFFITFDSCQHLDRKHSVFGKVIDGLPVVQAMQAVPTNPGTERPLQDINILNMQVLDNPAQEAEKMELRRLQAKLEARRANELDRKVAALGGPSKKRTSEAGTTISSIESADDNHAAPQVGRYLSKQHAVQASATSDIEEASTLTMAALPQPSKKSKKATIKFGDFSSW